MNNIRATFVLIILSALVACGGNGSSNSDLGIVMTMQVLEGERIDLESVNFSEDTLTYQWVLKSGQAFEIFAQSPKSLKVIAPEVAQGNQLSAIYELTVTDVSGKVQTESIQINVQSNDFVVYSASLTAEPEVNLFIYNLETNSRFQLNDSLAINESISSFRLSPDRLYIIYTVTSEVDNTSILYIVQNDGNGRRALFENNSFDDTIQSYKWSPNARDILLSAVDTDGISSLYHFNIENSNLIKVTPELGTNMELNSNFNNQWSPNGSNFTYAIRNVVDNTSTGYIGDVNSLESRRFIESTSPIFYPRWAVDSEQLFFYATTAVTEELAQFSVAIDGSNLHYFGEGLISGNAAVFAFSDDDLYAVLRVDDDINQGIDMYITRTDGSQRIKIPELDFNLAEILAAEWMGSKSETLVFTATTIGDTTRELYAVNKDGENLIKLNLSLVGGGNIVSTEYFSSSNSEWIAYIADQEVDGKNELYIVKPDGSQNTKISGALHAEGDVGAIRWSPDGKKLYYYADQFTENVGEIMLVDLDTASLSLVTDSTTPDRDANYAHWSPDSQYIIYYSDEDGVDGQYEYFSRNIDGTSKTKVNDTLVENGSVSRAVISWFTESDRLVYFSDQDEAGKKEIFSTTSAGADRIRINGEIQSGGTVHNYILSSRVVYPRGVR